MKQINLLPLSIQQKSQKKQLLPAVLTGVVLGLVVCSGLWMVVKIQVHDLKMDQEKTDENKQVDKSKKEDNTEQENDLKIKAVVNRINQINTLNKDEIDWSKVFNTVSLILQKDVVLSSYSLATAPNGVAFKGSGEAPSNLSFATYVQYLQENKVLLEHKVEGYSYNPASGGVTFSVSGVFPTEQVIYTK